MGITELVALLKVLKPRVSCTRSDDRRLGRPGQPGTAVTAVFPRRSCLASFVVLACGSPLLKGWNICCGGTARHSFEPVT